MKEFIEKLIGRLEEYNTKTYVSGITNNPYEFGACNGMDSAISIVNQLAEEYNNANDSMEIQIAKNYAKCLVEYGVDIREKWETATSQSMALEQAYLHGRQDERNRFAELQEEYNNDFCEWEYDEFETKWQTDCGVLFALHDSDNEITHYCPCCGKKIKVVE